MAIIIWIIFGAIVGLIASMMAGSSVRLPVDVTIGIAGALIGGYLMSRVGQSGASGLDLYSFLVALLGACVFIGIVHVIKWI